MEIFVGAAKNRQGVWGQERGAARPQQPRQRAHLPRGVREGGRALQADSTSGPGNLTSVLFPKGYASEIFMSRMNIFQNLMSSVFRSRHGSGYMITQRILMLFIFKFMILSEMLPIFSFLGSRNVLLISPFFFSVEEPELKFRKRGRLRYPEWF